MPLVPIMEGRKEKRGTSKKKDENCVALSLAIRDGEQVKSEKRKNLTAETIASTAVVE